MSDRRDERTSLLGATSVGTAWMVGSQVARQLVHLVFRVVLARILAPEDFGLLAMAMLPVSLTLALGALGIGSALVQRNRVSQSCLNTAFWSSVAIGLVFGGLFWVAAPLLAAFFGEESVGGLVRLMALVALFDCVGTVFVARLQRDLTFRALGVAAVLAVGGGGLAAVAAARAGGGAQALALGAVVAAAISLAVAVFASGWRPGLGWSKAELLELWDFGKFLTGAGFLRFVTSNIDSILIGKFVGSAPLGLYSLSYQAVVLPLQYVSRPAGRVLFSVMSTISEQRRRLQEGYLRSVGVLIAFIWPGIAWVAVAAPAIVPLLLGEQWRGAVPVLQVLCGVALFQSTLHVGGSVLLAMGRSDRLFRLQIGRAALTVVAVAAGLPWGVLGVAASLVATSALYLPVQIETVVRTAAISRGPLTRLYLGALLAIALTGALLAAVRWPATLDPTHAAALQIAGSFLMSYGLFLTLCPPARRSLARALRALRAGERSHDPVGAGR